MYLLDTTVLAHQERMAGAVQAQRGAALDARHREPVVGHQAGLGLQQIDGRHELDRPHDLRIEPPPSPKREQIADIASIIEEENIPPNIRVYSTPTSETNSQGSNQKARKFCFAGRSYLRDSFGSCGSSSKRPPKPLKSSTPKSPSRRPSMHRRVSFNSLPSPSEIDSFVPSLLSSSSSERTLSYTSSSERSLFSSASEGGRKTGHRKGSSKRVVPRSLNLSKFYC